LVPCTTVARTIFDMAEVLSDRRLERLLDEASYQEVLDLTALDQQSAHNVARKKARAKLRRALAAHRLGSSSPTVRSASRCWRSFARRISRTPRCSSGSTSEMTNR
jgi:hypothetical protein